MFRNGWGILVSSRAREEMGSPEGVTCVVHHLGQVLMPAAGTMKLKIEH